MDKLKLETKNLAEEKFKKLAELFPNAITETIVGQDEEGNNIIDRAIDADILRQEIADYVIEGREERYEFTWPDKKKSMLFANAPINKTLRPIRKDSLNFEETENLYIEGDNLDALKLLRETYLGKIKMIYIDPPYNKGKDFVYEDDFAQTMEDYKKTSGYYDEKGHRLFKNTDVNGRFHTDWLNMMYPRLKLARDILSNDGAILISIDDSEVRNLRNICDEIFGKQNFIGQIIVNKASQIATELTVDMHEYILVFAKSIKNFELGDNFKYTISRGTVGNENQTQPIITFPAGLPCYGIEDGIYSETRKIEGSKENITNLDPIVVKNGKLDKSVRMTARWRSSNDMRNFFANGCKPTKAKINGEIKEIYFENDRFNPQIKKRVREKFNTIFDKNKRGSTELEYLDINYFDNPKSKETLKYFITRTSKSDSIILDFFSGSATTAHAVMELNAEDGGNRKYIMVQLPEDTDEKSEAYKAGYKNICEIGKERIRRAGKKIREGNPESNFDDGFRVLRVDSSNMKDVYHNPQAYEQSFLDQFESNIKEDRSEEDLLFQVMLSLGIEPSCNIQVDKINGNKVLIVDDGFLIASFDQEISEDTIEEIAKKNPYYAVFSQGKISDSTLANFEQIFETYSPTTKRKVI